MAGRGWIRGLAAGAAWLALTGCDVSKTLQELSKKDAPEARIGADEPTRASSLPTASPDTIRIASFNIQVFGESKLEHKAATAVLAKVIRRFDVVAIQEIRAESQDFLSRFLEIVNADGSKYDFVIGPRLGRTSSKEQYAFVFNTQTIEVSRRSVYTVDDPRDLLHREPLVARFRVKGPPPADAFTFSLVDIHTDPDETDAELNALDDVFRAVQNDGIGEDDIILLGDLNVDERKLGELGRVPAIQWAISGVKTNTRQSHGYDNILFDRRTTTEYTGHSGVFDLRAEYGLTLEEALKVSDHYPVWAEFSVREQGPERLADDAGVRRTR